MKNRIKVLIAGLALTLSAGAQAATISANVAADLVVGDEFTVTIRGSDFADGTIGGGFTLSWDTTYATYQSGTEALTFDGDQTFGRPGDLTTPGFWTNADVTSFNGVTGPAFEVATISFLAAADNAGTAFNLEIGKLQAGSDAIWADASGFVDTNPTFVVVNEVPIPAAAWLFGSGLLGLAGLKRRKASA